MKSDVVEKKEMNGFLGIVKDFFKEYVIIYALVALFIILTIANENFLTASNMMNVLRQISMIAIMAAGVFLVLLTAGIDISVGAIVGLAGMIFAYAVVEMELPGFVAILFALAVGAFVGVCNGFMIAKIGIPPIIASLGMQSMARGYTYVMTDAYPIPGIPDEISVLGRGYLGFVPWPILIMLVVFLMIGFISQKTVFGRHIYLVGGNEEAAYLSGIAVVRVKWITYVINGALAALSGVILACRLASGQPNAGTGWEFEAVIAGVIGGVSVLGGKGKALGVFFGAFLVGLLSNGMNLLNVNSYYQQMIKGLVMVLAIGLDVYKNKKVS